MIKNSGFLEVLLVYFVWTYAFSLKPTVLSKIYFEPVRGGRYKLTEN